jgi:hypothetical protein
MYFVFFEFCFNKFSNNNFRWFYHLKALIIVRSMKLSNTGLGLYLDGWPPSKARSVASSSLHYFIEIDMVVVKSGLEALSPLYSNSNP